MSDLAFVLEHVVVGRQHRRVREAVQLLCGMRLATVNPAAAKRNITKRVPQHALRGNKDRCFRHVTLVFRISQLG